MSPASYSTLCFGFCCLPWLAPTTSAQAPHAGAPPSGYVLGPGDQISVVVEELPEEFANKTFRVDTNGELSIPLIGHIQAGGLSIASLETESRSRLDHILKDPQVTISLVNFGSEPISVLG